MITKVLPAIKTDFEDIYFAVRKLERRVYTDDQLRTLPDIDPLHVHAAEWDIRKRSSRRLISYLRKKGRSLRILEVGCGNGWLSAKLAEIAGADVIGLDINQAEISQASRVFIKDNLEFVYDVFNEDTFPDIKFDVIVFAASLQYFPSVKSVMGLALSLLYENGEVHIMDTHFYKSREIERANIRSRNYYNSLGFPEMTERYFHHSIEDLSDMQHHILLNPNSIMRLLDKRGPFHWITINH